MPRANRKSCLSVPGSLLINYSATFEERVEEQIEIQTYCDEIFGDKEFISLAEYTDMIKNQTSEMFLSVSRPFLILDHVHSPRQAALLQLVLQNAGEFQAEERARDARRANHCTDRLPCYDQEKVERRPGRRTSEKELRGYA